MRFNGEVLGYQGMALLSGSVRGDDFFGWTSLPNGADPSFRGMRTEPFEGAARGTVAMDVPEIDLPFIRPMMDYGRTSIPEQPGAVVVRNATVWTQGPQGIIEGADLLVRAGTVEAVGMDLDAPGGAVEIDASGKHVTPGMIDPHIHSGVSAVNESGFAIVPEVRMGDVVTHNNIWMYRQLAGGLTTAHIKPRFRESDRGRERLREDALGGAARGTQAGERAPHGEVCAGREPEAASGPLSPTPVWACRRSSATTSWPRATTSASGSSGRRTRRGCRRVATCAWRRSWTSSTRSS